MEKALEEIAEEEVAAEDSGKRHEGSGNEKQRSREFGQNTEKAVE